MMDKPPPSYRLGEAQVCDHPQLRRVRRGEGGGEGEQDGGGGGRG